MRRGAEGLAREALPAGCDLGRLGRQLRHLQRERGAGRPLPVRRRRHQRAAHPPGRADRSGLALLPARRPTRAALRLPDARPLRSGHRASVQPGQAADRPLRQADRRRGQLGRRALRLPHRRRRRRARRPRLRRLRAEERRHQPRLRVGRRHPAPYPARSNAHLRGPRQGLHAAAPRGARGAARDLRGARLRAGDRLPDQPRDHGRRAAAGASARHRPPPRRARARQLLGLQHHRLLRARHPLLAPRASR